MGVNTVKTAVVLTSLATTIITASAATIPVVGKHTALPQSNCHCQLVANSERSSTSSFLYTYRPSLAKCHDLGEQLEHWREHDAEYWASLIAEIGTESGPEELDASIFKDAPTPAEERMHPLSPEMIIESTRTKLMDGSIECHFIPFSMDSEDAKNTSWIPDHGSLLLICSFLMLAIAISAEFMEADLIRNGLLSRQSTLLADSEKQPLSDLECSKEQVVDPYTDSDEIDELEADNRLI